MSFKYKKILSFFLMITLIIPLCIQDLSIIHAANEEKRTLSTGLADYMCSISKDDTTGAYIAKVSLIALHNENEPNRAISFPSINQIKSCIGTDSTPIMKIIETPTSYTTNLIGKSLAELQIPDGYNDICLGLAGCGVKTLTISAPDTTITLDEKSCSSIPYLEKVKIDAEKIIFKDRCFSFNRTLSEFVLKCPADFVGGNMFQKCPALKTVKFDRAASIRFLAPSIFTSTSFASDATIEFKGTVTNQNGDSGYSVFDQACVDTISITDEANTLYEDFLKDAKVTCFNLETPTTLEAGAFSCSELTEEPNIDKLSINSSAEFAQEALSNFHIDNMYINAKNNEYSLKNIDNASSIGKNSKINTLFFNKEDAKHNYNNLKSLKDFSFGNTEDTSLNIDDIYFLDPEFSNLDNVTYDRTDGNTTYIHAYGGTILNNEQITSYDFFKNWMTKNQTSEDDSLKFSNLIKHDTSYTISHTLINLDGKSSYFLYDFSNPQNVLVYASMDAPTLNEEDREPFLLNLSTNNQKLFSTNNCYRIWERVEDINSYDSSIATCKYSDGYYYAVLTSATKKLYQGEYNYLIEIAGEKHAFTIQVLEHDVEKIVSIQPANGYSFHLNYGAVVFNDMLEVTVAYPNNKTGKLRSSQFILANNYITGDKNTISISIPRSTGIDLVGSFEVFGYPDTISTFTINVSKNIDSYTEKDNVIYAKTGTTLSLSDFSLSSVCYYNPSTPIISSVTSGFYFVKDGQLTDTYVVNSGTNDIVIDYLGTRCSISIIGSTLTADYVTATYIGKAVYEDCDINLNDIVITLYKTDGTSISETDKSLITLSDYQILPGVDNVIYVTYNGIKANDPIVVPGLKDEISTISRITYTGSHELGTEISPKDFYIELTMISGKVRNSITNPEIHNNITLSTNVLAYEYNLVYVNYGTSLKGSVPIYTTTSNLEFPTPTATIDVDLPSNDPTVPSSTATTTPVVTVSPGATVTPVVTPTSKPSKPKKGATYTVDNVKYKVLSIKGKSGTVETIGYKKTAKKITIKNTVKINGYSFVVVSIKKNAFKNCSKINGTVNLNGSIKKVGADAFLGCKNIKTLVIGKKLTTIGSKCFYKCSRLKVVNLKSASKLKTVGKSAFKKNAPSREFKVGVGKTAHFKKILKGAY